MNIEQVKEAAFKSELEKIALSEKTMISAAYKAAKRPLGNFNLNFATGKIKSKRNDQVGFIVDGLLKRRGRFEKKQIENKKIKKLLVGSGVIGALAGSGLTAALMKKEAAFKSELEKIALSEPTMQSAVKKLLMKVYPSDTAAKSGNKIRQAININEGIAKRRIDKKVDVKPFFDRLKKLHGSK